MTVRQFDTGATRSPLADKPQYEGYLSPLVIHRFGQYMLKHQTQADGQRRDADNWQKGIPAGSCIDSAWRHFEDWWLHHRGYPDIATEPLEEALCALIFNASARLKQAVEERLAAARDTREPVTYPMADELPPVAPPCCPGGRHVIGEDPDCKYCSDYRLKQVGVVRVK